MKSTWTKRPSYNDPEVLNRAAEMLFARMGDYGIECDDDAKAGALEEIKHAISCSSDGYERASQLDRKGWNANAQMVEWLDSDTRIDARREATRDWVKREQLVAQHAIGDLVKIARPAFYKRELPDLPDVLDGEIVGIHADDAEYVVFVPALGHKRSEHGPTGLILGFEDVENSTVGAAR